ncbi:MAG: Bro-N domain-containing protein [Xanthobacter sp.]
MPSVEPWFVAADVCVALGLKNTARAVRPLGRSECRIEGVHQFNTSAFDRRINKITLISESGLYKLVMRSDKPEARQFQDWVTRDVLPAIRKDGMYIKGEEKVLTGEMSDDELMVIGMQAMARKLDRLQTLKEAELDVMPVNKFLAHHDVYAGQPMRNRLSNAAKKLCLARGIEVNRRPRVLEDGRETYANEYPHSILVEAADLVGLTLLNNRYRPAA